MKLSIGDFLRRLINPDSEPEPAAEPSWDDDTNWVPPQKPKQPSIALCSPYSYPDQWKLELSKPCYCGLPAIWLDFYNTKGEVTAVGTCQHHRGVKQWAYVDDGPVRAYWSPCPTCPVRPVRDDTDDTGWLVCLGHIVVGDNLHTVI